MPNTNATNAKPQSADTRTVIEQYRDRCVAYQQQIETLRAALMLAHDHLIQYQRYSDAMSRNGRGLTLSSPYSEQYADTIIRAALRVQS